jgi:acetolactate synthase-1/2/3 large subunit
MVAPGKNNAQMIGLNKQAPIEISPESTICPECGHHNEKKANFCNDCGTKL